ncbi:hypothetical protein BV22DRAFT_1094142 [Leucogyrophana mollusca]|uniref:Uncharacterized protein n=1 Tax=Leucogyrophana mollusca TaxID=85980 RepID=A0ACB8BCK5_9AGAM|nr:hypothetical protein BV22DRAFT_1094142 [Leucogyrophana mollusca]
MSEDPVEAESPSEWHSIRPWTPHLALSVREITSVSATFILSSSLDDSRDPSLSALGLSPSDDEDDEADNHPGNEEAAPRRRGVVSDALAKGLSVDVNAGHWQRVLIRVDEQVDEAVIIIYGLMPGRQYDIDLGLVQGGQSSSIRRQVTTEESESTAVETEQEGDYSNFNTSTSSDSISSAAASLAIPESITPLPSNSSTPVPCSLEERLRQLQHSLSTLTAERDALTTSLKNARRESQKSDAALRSEIDILKRASEKNASAEHRAKQKVLALQEAAKRAQAATKEMEEIVTEVEALLPALNQQKEKKEAEYAKVKEEADKAREARESMEEETRKRLESLKGESTAHAHRLERLNGKREKLETSVVPDLEEQLRELEREIERAESGQHEYSPIDDAGLSENAEQQFGAQEWPSQPYPSSPPRRRHPGPIGRPLATPVQRTAPPSAPQHRPVGHHAPTASGTYRSPPSYALPAPTSPPGLGSAGSTTSSTYGGSSTLSSKAVPFEPTRSVAHAVRTAMPPSGSTYAFPPVQRPTHNSTSSSLSLPPPQLRYGRVSIARPDDNARADIP